MADTVQKENIMGTQKMSQLVLFTGIPLMISLFINSLYNFVDSIQECTGKVILRTKTEKEADKAAEMKREIA